MRKRRIVITMGDPAGIGPEIILKSMNRKGVLDKAHYAVMGNRTVMERTAAKLEMDFPFRISDGKSVEFGATPLLIEGDKLRDCPISPGTWSARTGRASLSYILRAVKLCMDDEADALVTAPICKAALSKAGCKYPGHTEIIADLTDSEKVVMMLAGGGLRVALVTTHAAVSALPQLVTRGEVFAAIMVTYKDLQKSFGLKNPRIAVLGLNPHAGENGILGSEEKVHIAPAMKQATSRGVKNLVGPLPADTAFYRMLKGEFDCILAMYHDQGLGPLKTIAFDSGVNITLGMPIIRTSVDHGTAFEIAGRGIASDKSLTEAIDTAIFMSRQRMKKAGK